MAGPKEIPPDILAKINPYPNRILLLCSLGLMAYISLVVWLSTLIPPAASFVIFGIVPIFLFPYWRKIGKEENWTWFIYLKTYSVLGTCGLAFGLSYFPDYYNHAIYLFWVSIFVNILEAAAFSYFNGEKFLAFLSVVLALSAPLTPDIKFESGIMLYQANIEWVYAYTIWNATFTYVCLPYLIGHQMAVLSVSLIVAQVWGPHYFYFARFMALGSHILTSNCFYSWFVTRFNTTYWDFKVLRTLLKLSTTALIAYDLGIFFLGRR